MGKSVECKIKPFTGTVTFFEPLTMPMVLGIDENLLEQDEFFEEQKDENGQTLRLMKQDTKDSKLHKAILTAVLPCVEKWELAGFPKTVTFETFPGSPRTATRDLTYFLIGELLRIYNGETEVPNE